MLTKLPWSMGHLVQIEMLDVTHNNLIVPPRSAQNMGVPAMLKWLRDNAKTGKNQRVTGLGLKSHSDATKGSDASYRQAGSNR